MLSGIIIYAVLIHSIGSQYSGKGYTSVPVLPDLTDIDLSVNAIAHIGADFQGVTQLDVLNMRRNSFTAFPDFSLTPVFGKHHGDR